MKRKFAGFTLVEVLVALVIFTVTSVALVRNATSSLAQAGMIRDRTVAWWIAENEMAQLRMLPRSDENYPAAGVNREYVEMMNVAWEVETAIATTENDYVRRVTIEVFKENDPQAQASLTGFLGRY